ncbi:redox-sensitive bicupin YhaK (pirin superfamily) [Rhodoferax ferrireducens]|uniref:Redox-sensitive bicupin YhaK (Pirin superfamily) n=1 Tax=Rhodoferax ferrireducens TaxID=192843 RepID=A0ABU2CAQ9_9BURK|nr:pirin family protein [Rhodoferax ferrireducens]MDR7378391.1 redox-sensitive bicupin YhaK (pirin superfamily) [Rhodoferax ferrireducens]
MGIALQLTGHAKDLGGGFLVRRFLPSAPRQSVGPFLFFDHFGPVTVLPGAGHDVRPHPHIGLATVTYLFEGAMLHRDSLGSVQLIEPGAINWMTAGRGIVHSERQSPALKDATYVNHGIQLWAALPQAYEEVEPSFTHTPAAAIPELTVGDADVRVLIGQAWGQTSPVATFAPTIYLDIALPTGGLLELPPLAQELAVYPVDGDVEIDGALLPAHTLALLTPGQATQICAPAAVRLVVLGGDALDGHRFISWNFVSSRKERIQQAEEDWKAQRMAPVPGDAEFIPLPERRPAA